MGQELLNTGLKLTAKKVIFHLNKTDKIQNSEKNRLSCQNMVPI